MTARERIRLPTEIFEPIGDRDIREFACVVCLDVPLQPLVKCTYSNCEHVLCRPCFEQCLARANGEQCFPCPACRDTKETAWVCSKEKMKTIGAWVVGCKDCWLRFSALEYIRHECVAAKHCVDCFASLDGTTLEAHRASTCSETEIACADCGRRHKRREALHCIAASNVGFAPENVNALRMISRLFSMATRVEPVALLPPPPVPERLRIVRLVTIPLPENGAHHFAWTGRDLVAFTVRAGGGSIEMRTLSGGAGTPAAPVPGDGVVRATVSSDGTKLATLRHIPAGAEVCVHDRVRTFPNLPPAIGAAGAPVVVPGASRRSELVWRDSGGAWALTDGPRLTMSDGRTCNYGPGSIRWAAFLGRDDWHVVMRNDGTVFVGNGQQVIECAHVMETNVEAAFVIWNRHVPAPAVVFALVTDTVRVCTVGAGAVSWGAGNGTGIFHILGFQTAAWLDATHIMAIERRIQHSVFVSNFMPGAPARCVLRMDGIFRASRQRHFLSPDGTRIALVDGKRKVTLADVTLPVQIEGLRARA